MNKSKVHQTKNKHLLLEFVETMVKKRLMEIGDKMENLGDGMVKCPKCEREINHLGVHNQILFHLR
jgi:hypothetical protein